MNFGAQAARTETSQVFRSWDKVMRTGMFSSLKIRKKFWVRVVVTFFIFLWHQYTEHSKAIIHLTLPPNLVWLYSKVQYFRTRRSPCHKSDYHRYNLGEWWRTRGAPQAAIGKYIDEESSSSNGYLQLLTKCLSSITHNSFKGPFPAGNVWAGSKENLYFDWRRAISN